MSNQTATDVTTQDSRPTTRARNASRSVIAAMYVGLTMTVIAMIAPYVDHATSNTLADHIRDGYPAYSQARIDSAVTTYLVYLSVVGALGVVGWFWTIHCVTRDTRWARGATTTVWLVGTTVALYDLLIRDTSGDPGLPLSLSLIGLLPCIPGLLAVVSLWRRP